MKPEFLSALKKIDEQQMKLFKELAQLDAKTLNQKPSDNAWSVLEIVQHMILIETASLKYVQKKLQFIDSLPSKNFVSAYRYWRMHYVNMLPIKLKAPKFKINLTIQNLNDAREQWKLLRADLVQMLEDVPNPVVDGLLFKHPLAGKMTLHHMLLFFYDHIERHKKQIQRTLKTIQ